MIGPGKYDDLATYVRDQTQADGVIVIVLRGNKGTGMSCQCTADIIPTIPLILEDVAKNIRSSAS